MLSLKSCSLLLLSPLLFSSTTLASSLFDGSIDSSLYRSDSNITYPASEQTGPTPLPHWVDLYNQVKAAGKIPGSSPSYLVNGNPTYPAGVDTSSNGICSWTTDHCFAPSDFSTPPSNTWALAFDDGPLPASIALFSFLKSQNQKATHFLIGSNIQDNPTVFQQAVSNGDHLAVHTWSHPMMTSLNDLQILGELGWTAQIIFDQSGLMPTFWRPPYGDVDNRVRAIAENVFGLKTVLWNQDANDWCINDDGSNSCIGYGPVNQEGIVGEMNTWAATKSSGVGVSSLQHELTTHSVSAFIQGYPNLIAKGWITLCIPDIFNLPWYKTLQTPAPALVHNSNSTLSSTLNTTTTSSSSVSGFSTSIARSISTSSSSSSSSTSTSNPTSSSQSSSTKVSGSVRSNSSFTLVVGIVIIVGIFVF